MTRLTPLLLLLGCDIFALEADSGATPADADADTDADTDTDTDTDEISPDAPTVTEVSKVDCFVNTDSEPTWIVEARVTDPQGDDNISVMDGYAVIIQDGIEGTQRPAVYAGGVLSASWTTTADEEPCEVEGKLRVVAVDDEGHHSAPSDVPLPVE